jgi:2-oxo-4-hydroxy-4-carboxy--5-ureidoimidazoline (OHCU) decarboxylase
LRHALQQEVNHASEEEKIALIEAHPDLVGRAVLTAESQGEQAAAGRFVTFARLLVCVAGATL